VIGHAQVNQEHVKTNQLPRTKDHGIPGEKIQQRHGFEKNEGKPTERNMITNKNREYLGP